jgi:hypothetical protein
MKPGTVVTMKTTDEPCLVLDVHDPQAGGILLPHPLHNYPKLSGVQVTVRRPKLTQDGVHYVIDTFYAEELQTVEDRQSKRLQEMESLKGSLGLPDSTPTN